MVQIGTFRGWALTKERRTSLAVRFTIIYCRSGVDRFIISLVSDCSQRGVRRSGNIELGLAGGVTFETAESQHQPKNVNPVPCSDVLDSMPLVFPEA
jgi:hypothetical protein